MNVLGLPDNLAEVVETKFCTAQAGGSLLFAETEGATVNVSGAIYQIRYSPSLSSKPNSSSVPAGRKPKPHDPFKDVDNALLIASIAYPHGDTSKSSTHVLVLNKYPIIPNHFILATYDDARQTDPLEVEDVWATYSLLRAWRKPSRSISASIGTVANATPVAAGGTRRDDDDSLFAFFNSGPASGASQPHRHVQFLPVSGMRNFEPSSPTDSSTTSTSEPIKSFSSNASGSAPTNTSDSIGSPAITSSSRETGPIPWQPLISTIASHLPPAPSFPESIIPIPNGSTATAAPLPIHTLRVSRFPCLAYAARLPASPTSGQLHATYLALLDLATAATTRSHLSGADVDIAPPSVRMGEEVPISYNIAMTTEAMVVMPRTEGEIAVKGTDGDVVEIVGVNGSVLAGTLLCKTREGFEALTKREGAGERVARVVEGVGIGLGVGDGESGGLGRL